MNKLPLQIFVHLFKINIDFLLSSELSEIVAEEEN